jgi:RNA polymerase sigma factor (sigma-70 family)
MGIVDAIKSFDETKGRFESLCFLSIKNEILQVLTKSRNYKNLALNDSFSLNAKLPGDENKKEILDFIKSEQSFSHEAIEFIDPEKQLMMKEEINDFRQFLHNKCSKRERTCYILTRQGYSYDEVAEKLGLRKKQVDNALVFMKQKIKKYKTEGKVNRNVG